MVNSCSHICNIENIPIYSLVNSNELVCADCDCKGPNLWICLFKNCLRIGCAEKLNDHSTLHNVNQPSHCVHMNLSTQRLWCYQCKKEVFVDAPTYNDSDQEAETGTARSHDSGHGSYSTLRTNTPDGVDAPERAAAQPSGDASDSSDAEEAEPPLPRQPRGLVGLQNVGNTCYMNAALQALSNTEPLTRFFLDCGRAVQLLSEGRRPGLSRTYQALMGDVWAGRGVGQGYVSPSGILYGIRSVHAMFRGYHQHDAQEFLRNFMDQLHEELKQPAPPDCDCDALGAAVDRPASQAGQIDVGAGYAGAAAFASGYESSDGEYETCDSGVSERSSLSDDTERPANSAKRRLSRGGSPNRRQRPKMHSPCVIDSQPSAASSATHKKPPKHRSIISDVFDGKLLSSVQCLTCDRVSSRVETFQDLSLPIPSRDHLAALHGRPGGACADALAPAPDGWAAWLWAWLRAWLYGPTVALHDCLAAFFSTDELKGDNMYSCERCSKLRNGIKFSKVLQLPEVLCIHLKRFRHELMYSSKISSTVSFPLKGLDMRPYLHSDCVSKVSTYELFSVICHHGTAGGGHYTCFALNSEQWYEFDDQYVTKVSADRVQNCEAYVLFYQKTSTDADLVRDKAEKILEETAERLQGNPSEGFKMTYVSRQWINRFYYCSEPGPIDNSDFLCPHGAVDPERERDLDQLAVAVPLEVFDALARQFGGPPPPAAAACPACHALRRRAHLEMGAFLRAGGEARARNSPPTHRLSAAWYAAWRGFAQGRGREPPGPIDNAGVDNGEAIEVPEAVWEFFHGTYGGGPERRVERDSDGEDTASEADDERAGPAQGRGEPEGGDEVAAPGDVEEEPAGGQVVEVRGKRHRRRRRN